MIDQVSNVIITYQPPIIKPVAPIAVHSKPKTYPATLEGAKESLVDLVKKGEKDWGTLEGAVGKVITEAKKRGLPEEKTTQMLETLRNHITRPQSSKFSNETKLSKINSIYNDIIKQKTPAQPAPTGTKLNHAGEIGAQLKELRKQHGPDKGTTPTDVSHPPRPK